MLNDKFVELSKGVAALNASTTANAAAIDGLREAVANTRVGRRSATTLEEAIFSQYPHDYFHLGESSPSSDTGSSDSTTSASSNVINISDSSRELELLRLRIARLETKGETRPKGTVLISTSAICIFLFSFNCSGQNV